MLQGQSFLGCSIPPVTISEEGRAELPGLYVPKVRADATSKGRASWAVAFHL